MRHYPSARLLAALLLAIASPALAQTATPSSPPAAGGQDTPAQAIPPSTDPCAARPADDTQTLSGQLADCGGVLTPPETGPTGIEAPVPAPDPGTTPVIPPGVVPDQPGGTGSADPT